MTAWKRCLPALAALAIAPLAPLAHAKRFAPEPAPADFELLGAPLGGPRAPEPSARPASLAGSTIAAWQGGAIVIDADSGELVRTDREGTPTARLAIGVGASQLVLDERTGRLYVADRLGDRIVVVDARAGLAEV